MESSIVEAIFLPWWRILVYFVGLVFAGITVRLSLKLDLNAAIESWQAYKRTKERLKDCKRCAHRWTLNRSSPYSRCNNCLALIATTTLLTARQLADIKPVILGEAIAILETPQANDIITSDYIGRRK